MILKNTEKNIQGVEVLSVVSFHYSCGKISSSTVQKQSKPWGLNQPTATVTLHPINLLWILCRDVLWWKSSGPFLTLPVVSSVTQAGGLCRITQWCAIAVSDVHSYYFMGTFLTGPLLTASSQSVPSIFHLPSVSQENPGDGRVCLSWLLRAKCLCLNRESRFLWVFFYRSDFTNLGIMIHVCVLRLNPPCGLQPQIRSGVGGRGGVQTTVCDEFWSVHCQALICLLRWQLFSLCPFIYVTFPLTRVKVARLHKQPPFTFKKRSSPNIIHHVFNPCSIAFQCSLSIWKLQSKAFQLVFALRDQAAPFLLWQKHRAAAACCP